MTAGKKTHLLQSFQAQVMGQATGRGFTKVIGDKHHRAACNLFRILKLQCPCRGVTRIGKPVLLGATLVELEKITFFHEHLSPDFDFGTHPHIVAHTLPSCAPPQA